MLKKAKNIFIVGIKGVAMTNLAVILKKMGKNIAGSDVEEEFITDEVLLKNNVSWKIGFNQDELPIATDLVIYSAAHQGLNNRQVVEARKRGIAIFSQSEFLGILMSSFKTKIAVCGCHGKTTTSSLLTYALLKLGAKPSYLVGAPTFNTFVGGDFAKNDYFVIEADEYGVNPPSDLTPKFHSLNPDLILCTNIDFDHPDVYRDLKHVKDEFLKFFDRKKLILCADDSPTLQLLGRLDRSSYSTYGYDDGADLAIQNAKINPGYSSFELLFNKKSMGEFKISIFGQKNISNAAGVILTLLHLGFKPEDIRDAVRNFSGAKRRFEYIFSKNDTYLFDDYGHHPKEIETTIQAARERFPKRRITIIFQPHTYSRTEALLPEFARSLSTADSAFILPVFPSARENSSDFTISSKDIEKSAAKGSVKSFSGKDEFIQHLRVSLRPSDIIFTMGAGDVYKLKNDIIDVIKKIA